MGCRISLRTTLGLDWNNRTTKRGPRCNPAPTVMFDLENHAFNQQLPHGKLNMDVRVVSSIGDVRWRIWLPSRWLCG